MSSLLEVNNMTHFFGGLPASHRLNGYRQNLSEPASLAAHERARSYPAGPLLPAQLRPIRGLFRHPGLPTTGEKGQGALLPADGDL